MKGFLWVRFKPNQNLIWERKRKKLDGELVSGYVVGNQKRFDTFVTKEERRELRVDFSIFEELGEVEGTQ